MSEITKEKKTSRNSAIELLRIISMLLIVGHHYSVYGGGYITGVPLENKIVIDLLMIGGQLGVSLFVLISAYFMSTQTQYKWKHIVKTVITVTVFSVLLYVFAFATSKEAFSLTGFFKSFFPVVYAKWWFATTYTLLMLIAPLLSRIIQKMSQKLHAKLILLLVIMWSVIPTFTTATFDCSDLIWFVCLYFVAGYIRKYPLKYLKTAKRSAYSTAVWLLLIMGSIAVFDLLGERISFFSSHSVYFTAINMLPLFLLAASLFLLFLNLPAFNCKVINILAGSMFGVYLIHDHSFMRNIIWNEIFRTGEYALGNRLLLHLIITIPAVFFGCTLLSMLVNLIFGRMTDKCAAWIEKLIKILCNKTDTLIDKVIE